MDVSFGSQILPERVFGTALEYIARGGQHFVRAVGDSNVKDTPKIHLFPGQGNVKCKFSRTFARKDLRNVNTGNSASSIAAFAMIGVTPCNLH